MNSFKDLYAEGYTTNLQGYNITPPLWVKQFKVYTDGLWVLIKKEDLLSVIKTVSFDGPLFKYCHGCVADPPTNILLFNNYFSQLETEGWNLVCCSPYQTFESMGMTFSNLDGNGLTLTGKCRIKAYTYIGKSKLWPTIDDPSQLNNSEDFQLVDVQDCFTRLILSDNHVDVMTDNICRLIYTLPILCNVTMDTTSMLIKDPYVLSVTQINYDNGNDFAVSVPSQLTETNASRLSLYNKASKLITNATKKRGSIKTTKSHNST